METFKHTKGEDRVWFTSDLHLGHDKEFIWKARGFNSVEEMNERIIDSINFVADEKDTLYILGDLALCPIEEARYWLSQIKCPNVVVIAGNHDTDNRLKLYKELGFKVQFGARLKYDKYHFFLSHYPTLTENPGEDKLTLAHTNLFGHTHQTYRTGNHSKFSYNVGMDAHKCCLVDIETIIIRLKDFIQKENEPAIMSLEY